MIRAQITTPWVGDGLSPATSNRPKLTTEFTLAACHDVTGQPAENITPEPNAFTVEVTCTQATLDAITAAGYPVLWSEAA